MCNGGERRVWHTTTFIPILTENNISTSTFHITILFLNTAKPGTLFMCLPQEQVRRLSGFAYLWKKFSLANYWYMDYNTYHITLSHFFKNAWKRLKWSYFNSSWYGLASKLSYCKGVSNRWFWVIYFSWSHYMRCMLSIDHCLCRWSVLKYGYQIMWNHPMFFLCAVIAI